VKKQLRTIHTVAKVKAEELKENVDASTKECPNLIT
jgi:hypothetical protein